MGRGKKKGPAAKHQPTSGVPKIHEEPRSPDQHKISWQFSRVDLQHDRWGWHMMDHADFVQLFTEGQLRHLESQTWAQLKTGGGSHEIPIYRLSQEAQKRLEELRLDDRDAVFSLRITGRHRIIGVRSGASLQLLWNDPEHEVCPSQKKHT